jgi:hypothetical protein
MKTAKSQNIPDFQRDFTEIFETVLRSENFACKSVGDLKFCTVSQNFESCPTMEFQSKFFQSCIKINFDKNWEIIFQNIPFSELCMSF